MVRVIEISIESIKSILLNLIDRLNEFNTIFCCNIIKLFGLDLSGLIGLSFTLHLLFKVSREKVECKEGYKKWIGVFK